MQLAMFLGVLYYGKFRVLDANYLLLVKLSILLDSTSLLARIQFMREGLGKITFLASLIKVVITAMPSFKPNLAKFGVRKEYSTLASCVPLGETLSSYLQSNCPF